MAKTSPSSSSTPAPAPAAEKDWPAQLTDKIVDQIDTLRDRITGPVVKAVQYSLFGAFAVSLGTVALLIALVGTLRAINNYLPSSIFGDEHMWLAHTILGAILFAVGLLLNLKKKKASS